MTIAQRIKSLFGNVPPPKSNAWSGGAGNSRNTRAQLDMALVGLVYRCLRKRAQALVDTDFIIGESVSQTEIKSHDVDHWLVKLLNNPNKEHDAIELIRLTQMWFDTNGNAFWLVTVNDLGLPEQIHVIPPPNVTIQFNNGEVIGRTLNDWQHHQQLETLTLEAGNNNPLYCRQPEADSRRQTTGCRQPEADNQAQRANRHGPHTSFETSQPQPSHSSNAAT